MFYFHNYGFYLNAIDRDKLTKPFDFIVEWAAYCYILFCQTELNCRNNVMKKIMLISNKFNYDVTKNHCKSLANIFINNKCHIISPESNKEAKQKIIKLSN